MRSKFVPTHRLKDDIAEYGLKAGTPLRVTNPLAYGYTDAHLNCYEERDWRPGGTPWILLSSQIEPLPDWPELKQVMIGKISQH